MLSKVHTLTNPRERRLKTASPIQAVGVNLFIRPPLVSSGHCPLADHLEKCLCRFPLVSETVLPKRPSVPGIGNNCFR
jgi:hypothetical protein